MSVDDGLRPIFRKFLPEFDWQSIETGGTGRGIPDSNYCTNGLEGWIEFKATKGWTCPLRPEQVGWIMRRVRHGGRVHVAVRQRAPAGARREAADALWLFGGMWAMRAKEDGLRGAWAEQALVTHGGPAAWDWRAIAARLTTPASGR